MIAVYSYRWVPDFARGLVRDLRVRWALEEAGMGLKDVQVVPMPMGEMAGSLARRQVDAAAFFPPFSEYALRVGLAQVLFDSSRIPG